MKEYKNSSQHPITGFDNMTDVPAFKTSNEFSLFIEKMAVDKKLTHLEAVLLFCSDHLIDPDDIASKVNKSLKSKIEQNFRDLNYLPKQAQLDM